MDEEIRETAVDEISTLVSPPPRFRRRSALFSFTAKIIALIFIGVCFLLTCSACGGGEPKEEEPLVKITNIDVNYVKVAMATYTPPYSSFEKKIYESFPEVTIEFNMENYIKKTNHIPLANSIDFKWKYENETARSGYYDERISDSIYQARVPFYRHLGYNTYDKEINGQSCKVQVEHYEQNIFSFSLFEKVSYGYGYEQTVADFVLLEDCLDFTKFLPENLAQEAPVSADLISFQIKDNTAEAEFNFKTYLDYTQNFEKINSVRLILKYDDEYKELTPYNINFVTKKCKFTFTIPKEQFLCELSTKSIQEVFIEDELVDIIYPPVLCSKVININDYKNT